MSLDKAPKVLYFNITSPAEYVVHIEINRPAKLNSFFTPMWYELKSLFEFFSHDPCTRVILLSGAGDRAFTSGLDVAQASSPDSTLRSTSITDPARKATSLRRHILELQDTISAVARCEKPTIALIHGYAYGLGIDLSSACDIRMCDSKTQLCVKEVDIGLAADVGTLSRIGKVTGGVTSWVKEVCLTARPFTAEEALQNRFVSRVTQGGKSNLISEGLKLAELLASKSPVAVSGTKNILDASWGRTIEDNLNYTAVWNAGMLQSEDVDTAMMSGLKKQKPKFSKL
ncbi:hypothetical protein BT93_L5036 [Corymbia citriodora subsp. variegata]|uniref:Enoyl-CoA hydratase n=1 Tax=Corymbia citriodora subsp. variegata TaxID=360336 RepID=A0A8T0CJK2_CORYI|nr:hypothetical protein BT93_L5036 [Corymbia citriodora subsp. variegata]